MKTKLLLLASIAISLAFVSCHKKEKAVHEGEMTVDVAEAQIDSVLLSKTYPGTVKAQNSVDIVGRVNGTLNKILYNGAAHVKKGEILFRIEDTAYRDAVQQAEGALANAQSQYEYNKKHYEALKKALESDAVAQIQVIEAKSAVEQSEAAIKEAQAQLQNARTNLGYCTVTAPFEGDLTKPTMSEGAYVSGAGAPVKLATIYENAYLFADFYIEDASYEKAFLNENNRHLIDYDNVPVHFNEQLPHSYAGKLSYIAPGVDTGTGTLLLRIALDNPYNELRDGMYCTVDMPYKVEPKAILVKDASISTSQTNKFIYVVNDSNRVVYTPIEVGELANDSMRIVTSGLKGGEKYVTKALLKVRPGMEVKTVLTK